MGQIITAMYRSRAAAEEVQNRLRSLGIVKDDDAGHPGGILDRTNASYREGHYSSTTDRGLWSDTDWSGSGTLPDEDRHAYEEGVHRGHAVLNVTVDDQMADRAREIIRDSNPLDMDVEQEDWGRGGWTRPMAETGGTMAGGVGAADMGDAPRVYDRYGEGSTGTYRSYRRDDGLI